MLRTVTGLYERLSGRGGLYIGAGEAECQVESAKQICRPVNVVQGGICENAFRPNGLDQYKAAVLGWMHWIPVLCVLPLVKFALESTVPVMLCGRCSREVVLLGRVDAAVQCSSTELGITFVLTPDVHCLSSGFRGFAIICWNSFLRIVA